MLPAELLELTALNLYIVGNIVCAERSMIYSQTWVLYNERDRINCVILNVTFRRWGVW